MATGLQSQAPHREGSPGIQREATSLLGGQADSVAKRHKFNSETRHGPEPINVVLNGVQAENPKKKNTSATPP